MFIKTNGKDYCIKKFINSSDIVFVLDNEISEDDIGNIIEMYSSDEIPMFLSSFNTVDYNVKVKTNTEGKSVVVLAVPKSLEDVKSEKIQYSKEALAEWLENNPIQFTDGKYYSVTEEKQALLNGNLASYERATKAGIDYPLKWNSTGNECTEWLYEDLVALSLIIAAFVAPKVSMQQSYEIQIKACTTIEELDRIVIDYN